MTKTKAINPPVQATDTNGKQPEITDVAQLDPVAEAKKVIDNEKKERANRASAEIDFILSRENCELHFVFAFDSRNPANPVLKRLIVAK